KKGPFSVEQINRDLASRIYRDDAYWAWHEGLPEWVPLHAIPGINSGIPRKNGPSLPPVPVVKPPKQAEHLIQRVTAATPITETTASTIVTMPIGYKPQVPDLSTKTNIVPAPVAPMAPMAPAPVAKEQDIFMKRPPEPAPAKDTILTTVVATKPAELLAQAQPMPETAKKNSVSAPPAFQTNEPDIFFQRGEKAPEKSMAAVAVAPKVVEQP